MELGGDYVPELVLGLDDIHFSGLVMELPVMDEKKYAVLVPPEALSLSGFLYQLPQACPDKLAPA